jgi:hypothetical protein
MPLPSFTLIRAISPPRRWWDDQTLVDGVATLVVIEGELEDYSGAR